MFWTDEDGLVRTINPRARFMVHEENPSAEMQALDKKREPVLFQCMGCFCGNRNY